MIIVRFRETFRERMPEWALATGMLAWGMITLLSTNLFTVQEFFHPLLLIMSQTEWGVLIALTGLVRLVFLVINGAWRPSAHIRAVGCVLGAMLWSNLLIASLALDWATPTVAFYGTFLALDLLSLWFSAGDAKRADIFARSKKA